MSGQFDKPSRFDPIQWNIGKKRAEIPYVCINPRLGSNGLEPCGQIVAIANKPVRQPVVIPCPRCGGTMTINDPLLDTLPSE